MSKIVAFVTADDFTVNSTRNAFIREMNALPVCVVVLMVTMRGRCILRAPDGGRGCGRSSEFRFVEG